jgi:hypothetical protein
MWSAVIHSSQDPALAHRTILIKGPSRAAWLTEHAAFGKKIQCAATTKYHRETVGKILLDEDRRLTHWLLVFPVETYLDNVILSGDPFRITNKKIHGILQKVDGSKAEYRTITANWRIADKFGGRLLEPEKEQETELNDIF